MVLNCADDTKLLRVAKIKSEEITESPHKTSKTANDLHDVDKCNKYIVKKNPKQQMKKTVLAFTRKGVESNTEKKTVPL